ncbi:MAG: hypothetical protein WKF51_03600 [Geodermatophilaceae bacterium]
MSGPGGCGKTRLAIAAAAGLADHFPDGIYFVPLEEVSAAEVMWTTIAEVLGVGGDDSARATVLEQLAGRRSLLLLDNLEQLTGAADVVAELLAAGPSGAVLATSRRPLHLLEEYEHPVPPLTLPTAEDAADQFPTSGGYDANRQESGAVELFIQRARMVKPDFAVTPDNRASVAEICRRLDGLPLGIELAAARVRLIGPRALLSRLDASLEITGVRRGRPARQQTLRSAIAWSYGLLPADQQGAFRRLGVLAGGGDFAACAAVTGTAGDPLDLLSHLVDASLVQLDEDADGEPRMRLLQTIASFAERGWPSPESWSRLGDGMPSTILLPSRSWHRSCTATASSSPGTGSRSSWTTCVPPSTGHWTPTARPRRRPARSRSACGCARN